jgi:hypothetical protein
MSKDEDQDKDEAKDKDKAENSAIANEDDVTPVEALEEASEPAKKPRFFGAPAMLKMKRNFVGALPTEKFDDLIALIRELMHDPGVVERKDASFTWSSSPGQHTLQPEFMVVVRIDGMQTTLMATDRLDAILVHAFGKVGGLVVTGGLVAPIAVGAVIPALGPAVLVGWLGGAYAAMRGLYRRLVGNRAKKLKTVFDSVACQIQPIVAT